MSFADAVDLPEFKSWLVTTIEPLCDADPVVMSDYIVALLKHDAVMAEDEWKVFISRELADFLEDSAKPFVDTLFQTLATKSYLPTPAPISPPKAPAIVSSYRPASISTAFSTPIAGPSTIRQDQNRQVRVIDKDVEMGESAQIIPSNGQPGPARRKKCFDYHERGFCMRGTNCPYEHSDDVIIPTPEMMFGGQFPSPFMGQPGGGRGMGRGRGRGRGMSGLNQNGNAHPMGGGSGSFPQQMPYPFPFPFQQMPGQSNHKNEIPSEYLGSNRPPAQRDTTSLVITDIPQAHLSVQAIRDYFQQFGDVTNVAVEGKSKRALISFETNQQAFQAWKSDDAVFGSRHVKVLWHRPRPGQGGAGQEALEKSADLLANMRKLESGEGLQGNVKAKLSGPESRLKATLAELEVTEKRAKKETLMAEQKVLLNKAQGASKEEKVQILGRLKELSKEMEGINNPPKTDPMDLELSEKERLDRELAKHGMETTEGKDQAELLKLSAQLSALRDKADTLGINPSARFSPYSRGGSRGRGYTSRARGRGRGGPSRPMRLDNRSRTITISGDGVNSDEGKKAAQEWYESQGGVTEFVEGGMKITYPARDMAEKVLALGTKDISGLSGGIQINWYNPPAESHAPEVEMADEEPIRGDRYEEE
ncbi:uncharacterized protein IL334_000772 [Kwoniella shivajii]|uniref:C3H1-type domain-containing protein n=1 Tax=Kwoniella shivajii TaxID=564305 RepID=A0ABZ1CQ33_9TREE|nr:hypothetical protein IL334_000772 [Kwoniella shivajii]